MNNQEMVIKEVKNPNGSYSIILSNAIFYKDIFKKINCIIRKFVTGDELFLGSYKKDGIYLSKKEMIKYAKEIPEYFKNNGDYYVIDIVVNNKRLKSHYGDLVVCHAPNDDNIYEVIFKMFEYYLETIVFCPSVNWDIFINSYKNYINHGAKDYVINGYTEFLFTYVDSGDFIISFDPRVNDYKFVRKEIDKILFQ